MKKKKIELNPVSYVKETLRNQFGYAYSESIDVDLTEAYGKYLSRDIVSNEVVPAFSKSTVDGYAVKFISEPCSLNKIGATEMGKTTNLTLKNGECLYVPTGGMIPSGTDTMVMIEDTEVIDENTIKFNGAFINRENIIEAGSDMNIGDIVLKKGRLIGTHEIGALASLGIYSVPVFKPLNVAFISTGDELVRTTEPILEGQIREINAFTLTAIANRLNMTVKSTEIVKDNYDWIKSAIETAVDTSDMVFVSGGSSVGEKDYTFDILEEVCDQGVIISGMAFKPGKPTLIAKHGNKVVVGLPGHPVSSIIVFEMIASEILRSMGFEIPAHKSVEVEIMGTVYPAKGRDTYQMVQIRNVDGAFKAFPTSGKSGMITLLTNSNGYVIIPKELEKIEKGTQVRAYYFE